MAGRQYWEQWERATGALEVVASELVVTSPGGAEIREYAPLAALLRRVQNAFGIDLAFVSEWCGEPVVRDRREADALHALYGRRYLERNAPEGVPSRFDALPVVTRDGQAHGTLCFRLPLRASIDTEIDGLLRSVAALIAGWFAAAC